MKKIIRFLSKLLILLVLGVGLYKGYALYNQKLLQSISLKRQSTLPNNSFTLMVLSEQDPIAAQKSVFSILNQKYDTFRLIYLENGPEDEAALKAQEMASFLGKSHLFTSLPNPEKKPFMDQVIPLLAGCPDREIVLILPSNDALTHEHVLEKLNRCYQMPGTWMTYGNYLDYPSYKQIPIPCKPFPKNMVFNNSYRSHSAPSIYPVTFYAGLFKEISSEDLYCDPHNFTWNYALPLLEMSGKHARFINEFLYLHSRITDQEDASDSCESCKKRPQYKRLKLLPFSL